jgi:hypothetical protein
MVLLRMYDRGLSEYDMRWGVAHRYATSLDYTINNVLKKDRKKTNRPSGFAL